jgi:hypothetical protein
MNKCPTCGSEVRPGDNFCLTCGNRLPPVQPSSTLTSDATVPAQDWSVPSAPPPAYDGWGNGNDRTVVGTEGSSSELPTVRADADELPTVRAEEDESQFATVRADVSAAGPKLIEHPARFVIRAPNGNIVQDYLLEKPKVVIGRVPESDIYFPEDRLVSRLHATILYEDGQYVLRDEGSANGTLVNNQPLEKSTNWTLRDGDQVLIGDHELTFKGATPPPAGIEESETVIIPFGGTAGVAAPEDEDKTITAIDAFGTQTMNPADLPFAKVTPSAEPSIEAAGSNAPVSQVEAQAAPAPEEPSAPQTPSADVTASSFSNLSQPALPNVDTLLAASTNLNEQIASLQQQLQATQEAMHNHNSEVSQTADRLRVAMRRLADRMDATINSVARSRGEMDWDGLEHALQDVLQSPRDIGYAMEFSRRAPDVGKVIQRYQGVLNTLAECNSLLRGLIGEDRG